ncbi:MAG TPA: cyanophycin synthetase, partial [Thermoleophilaceae bacterium]|nr:cyanophycin synthetase [Thermoleophilaceae bacterium]
AGLGGRHDATNVIPSKVQVLTGVGLEHTRWLGPTVGHIAEEKVAVVPDHGCLVTPDLDAEAEAVAARVTRARGARRVRLAEGAERAVPMLPHAPGRYQRRNFALARAAAEAFLERPLDAEAVRSAAAEVVVPGRLECVAERPLVLHDGAHNPAAAEALAESLPDVVGARPLVGVIAVLDDKDASGVLRPLLPLLSAAVLTRGGGERYLPPATLASLAGQLVPGLETETVRDPREGVARARELAGPKGVVLVTGSLHLLGDLVRAPGARASSL